LNIVLLTKPFEYTENNPFGIGDPISKASEYPVSYPNLPNSNWIADMEHALESRLAK